MEKGKAESLKAERLGGEKLKERMYLTLALFVR